jgi:hypothetical protein
MKNNNVMWGVLENIILYILVGFLFWLTRNGWVFLLLIFVNTFKSNKDKDNKN